MVFNKEELLSDLKQYVVAHITFVEGLYELPETVLQKKIDDKTWSVLECLEHLNLYAIFYNTEISKRMLKSKHPNSNKFISGYLGNKFALDMLPKEGMKTMSTFKSKNPIYTSLEKKEVLDRFILLQKELLDLLSKAKSKDITKIKTAITLPLLKFRLGDTFRFVIYHNERHITQAKKLLK